MVFFLKKKKDLENDLSYLTNLNSSVIFFISAKKFDKKRNIIKKYFSKRKLIICKEITKLYEDYFIINVSEINEIDINLRGEITLVFSPIISNESNKLLESDKKKIKKLIKKLTIKDIVEVISKNKKISKKEIYNFCLKLKNEK